MGKNKMTNEFEFNVTEWILKNRIKEEMNAKKLT